MSRVLSLVIEGDPIAQKRHRHVSQGKFVRTYDPSSKDKERVFKQVEEYMPAEPLTTPLSVKMHFAFMRPKSHFGTGRNSKVVKGIAPIQHTKKPDIDNCCKFVMDVLNGRAYHDDAQIIRLEATKEYVCENPYTLVEINP